MHQIFGENFTQEGVQKEASPDYQKYVSELFNRLCRSTPLGEDFRSLIRRALELVQYMTQPDGYFPSIGDTQGDKLIGKPSSSVISDLLRIDDQTAFAVKDLSRSGYIIVRSEASLPPSEQMMFFLTGMAYTPSHKHADELSFTLFLKGQPFLIDSGKYAYQYDEKRRYVRSAAAHNTVCLEETEVAPTDIPEYSGSFLSRVSVHSDFLLLRGSIERPRLFSHERRIRIYDAGRFRILDSVTNYTEDRIVNALHLAPGCVPEPTSEGYKVPLINGGNAWVKPLSADDSDITFGGKSPYLGWHSPQYKSLVPIHVIRSYSSATIETINIGWEIRYEP